MQTSEDGPHFADMSPCRMARVSRQVASDGQSESDEQPTWRGTDVVGNSLCDVSSSCSTK